MCGCFTFIQLAILLHVEIISNSLKEFVKLPLSVGFVLIHVIQTLIVKREGISMVKYKSVTLGYTNKSIFLQDFSELLIHSPSKRRYSIKHFQNVLGHETFFFTIHNVSRCIFILKNKVQKMLKGFTPNSCLISPVFSRKSEVKRYRTLGKNQRDFYVQFLLFLFLSSSSFGGGGERAILKFFVWIKEYFKLVY